MDPFSELPYELFENIIEHAADWVSLESLIKVSPRVAALLSPDVASAADAEVDPDAIRRIEAFLCVNPVKNYELHRFFRMCTSLRLHNSDSTGVVCPEWHRDEFYEHLRVVPRPTLTSGQSMFHNIRNDPTREEMLAVSECLHDIYGYHPDGVDRTVKLPEAALHPEQLTVWAPPPQTSSLQDMTQSGFDTWDRNFRAPQDRNVGVIWRLMKSSGGAFKDMAPFLACSLLDTRPLRSSSMVIWGPWRLWGLGIGYASTELGRLIMNDVTGPNGESIPAGPYPSTRGLMEYIYRWSVFVSAGQALLAKERNPNRDYSDK
ncbi:uncharacterized protein BO97DRAFT_422108 [Aspergillus homomorphus CBS 101889]|uniref:Uncharacterized protein n=1 Tax=Aspergillus homomorphus (strain CBS 101889) TaxID=1450537 RepID=A0A395I4T1_ASPHC|nr:hypothetical protein BO97DRAFT_422108 [Aspergillus homomorphus CBS 101889]RAL14756.1 hypothetical protein BO97DRAFT_422108 [Aspergillus homomorphus CBS 101889]